MTTKITVEPVVASLLHDDRKRRPPVPGVRMEIVVGNLEAGNKETIANLMATEGSA
jgi:hypothetical protein